MASAWYNAASTLCEGAASTINFGSDTIQVLLLKVAGFDATHADVAAVLAGAADEADATNYARGTLGGKSVASAAGTTKYDANDQLFSALGGAANNTIVAAVVFKFITNDNNSLPLWYIDGNDLATNGGDFTVAWHANGIATVA